MQDLVRSPRWKSVIGLVRCTRTYEYACLPVSACERLSAPFGACRCNASLVEERAIPCCSNGDACRKSAGEVREPDTQGGVLHAQGLEAQTRDGADVADTFLALPANTCGQVDLLEQSQAGDETLRQAVGMGPVTKTFAPRRGIMRRRGLVGLRAAVRVGVGSIGIGGGAIESALCSSEQRQCRQCGRLEERHAVRRVRPISYASLRRRVGGVGGERGTDGAMQGVLIHIGHGGWRTDVGGSWPVAFGGRAGTAMTCATAPIQRPRSHPHPRSPNRGRGMCILFFHIERGLIHRNITRLLMCSPQDSTYSSPREARLRHAAVGPYCMMHQDPPGSQALPEHPVPTKPSRAMMPGNALRRTAGRSHSTSALFALPCPASYSDASRCSTLRGAAAPSRTVLLLIPFPARPKIPRPLQSESPKICHGLGYPPGDEDAHSDKQENLPALAVLYTCQCVWMSRQWLRLRPSPACSHTASLGHRRRWLDMARLSSLGSSGRLNWISFSRPRPVLYICDSEGSQDVFPRCDPFHATAHCNLLSS
nr:hypothetical protein CFP56_11525 [Quercus suber]